MWRLFWVLWRKVIPRYIWLIEVEWRIYASVNWVIIGSDKGLPPGRREANWTVRNKLQWNLNPNSYISFTKMYLKMWSGKWRSYCLGLHVLKFWLLPVANKLSRNTYPISVFKSSPFVWRMWTHISCGVIHRMFTGLTPLLSANVKTGKFHDDVIKWKHLPRYWPFVWGIHRCPVNSRHKGQWRGALMFSLLCFWYKRSSKHLWGWWFETLSRSFWRHCNVQPEM